MDAYKTLEAMRVAKYIEKNGKEPHPYFLSEFKVKKPKTAAQLEALIVEMIELASGVCTKVYSGGRRIVTKTNVTDVTGRRNSITDDKFVPSTTEKGTSDLIACIKGRAYYLEVKFAKSDRQSADQKQFQMKVERAGAPYLIIKTLDEVLPLLS